ncbi:MAG: DUF3999 family protein [Syntrophorhabdaceae bacterium]
MNKIRHLSIAALIFLAFSVTDVHAEVASSHFPHKAPIQGATVKNMLYRAPIGAKMLERCSNSCLNARIFDSAGREIPFVIYGRKYGQSSKRFSLDILSLDEKPDRTILVLKRRGDSGQTVNILEMATSERDFHKSVTLEGSNDTHRWTKLGESSVYDFSSQVALRRTAIAIKANTYVFLRCTIRDTKTNIKREAKLQVRYEGIDLSTSVQAEKKIHINGFYVKFEGPSEGGEIYDEQYVFAVVKQNEKAKTTEMIIDTRLPVETVVLEIDDPYYLRNVAIYGWRSKTEDPVLLGHTSIHNLSIADTKEVNNYVDFPEGTNYRYYKLVIKNRENPPLKILRISSKWTRKELFFIALDNDRQYWLYTGNDDVQPVSYDIASIVNEENKDKQPADILAIGPVIANADYKPGKQETTARTEKFFLTAVIFMLVIIAGIFLFRLWKTT